MSTEKKLTAVEWLIEKYFGGVDNCTPNFKNHIKQAKEKEKQQIIEAYRIGKIEQKEAEQYYQETYKKD